MLVHLLNVALVLFVIGAVFIVMDGKQGILLKLRRISKDRQEKEKTIVSLRDQLHSAKTEITVLNLQGELWKKD